MIKIRSPAKVNLFLEVLGRRSDGYHEVQTILQAVSLYDEITLREQDRGINVYSQALDLPKGRENLAYQAAQLLQEEGWVGRGVKITIDKRIPIASGLGGGSSDAAATLVGLNRLWNLGIGQAKLFGLARRLGTDVPFFLRAGTALATGRGDELTQISPPRLWLILVTLGFKISAAQAYQNLGLPASDRRWQAGLPSDLSGGLTKGPNDIKMMMAALRSGDVSAIGKALYNRLEETVIPRYPIVGQIRDELDGLGAVGCLMSGSGPAVFALAQNREAALEIYNEASRLFPLMERIRPGRDQRSYGIYLVQTIDRGVEVAEAKGGED